MSDINWQYAPSSYGYASSDYIKYVYSTYPVAAASSSGSAAVRTGPGDTYTSIGSVPDGRTVLVLSESGSWFKILYNGAQTGFVSAQNVRSLMAWPVPASRKINQYFGTHKCIDIGAAVRGVPGDIIIAAQQGKVVYSGILKILHFAQNDI